MMRFGSVYSPASLTRRDGEPGGRLIFLIGLLAELPELNEVLGDWLGERVEEESASWSDRHVPNAAEPVEVLRALGKAGHPTIVAAERAKEHLLRRLNGVYAWEQLLVLRELQPDIVTAADWADLQNRFEHFATDFTDQHDDIDRLEDVDSLISLGNRLGVHLEPMEIEFVRDEVSNRIGQIEEHLEAQQEDREPRGLRARAGEDREITALFGRLADGDRG